MSVTNVTSLTICDKDVLHNDNYYMYWPGVPTHQVGHLSWWNGWSARPASQNCYIFNDLMTTYLQLLEIKTKDCDHINQYANTLKGVGFTRL